MAITSPVSGMTSVMDYTARFDAHLIEASVRRILASRWTNLEVLVLDDGSADRTSEIVRQAFDVDPTNQRAREVMARVQHAFDSQERRREVEQIVRKAKGFVQHGSFDEAMALLTEAGKRLHEPPEITEAIAEAEKARKARTERRVRRASSACIRPRPCPCLGLASRR